jgi:hypothetical protein
VLVEENIRQIFKLKFNLKNFSDDFINENRMYEAASIEVFTMDYAPNFYEDNNFGAYVVNEEEKEIQFDSKFYTIAHDKDKNINIIYKSIEGCKSIFSIDKIVILPDQNVSFFSCMNENEKVILKVRKCGKYLI